jgi:hypothetical protein
MPPWAPHFQGAEIIDISSESDDYPDIEDLIPPIDLTAEDARASDQLDAQQHDEDWDGFSDFDPIPDRPEVPDRPEIATEIPIYPEGGIRDPDSSETLAKTIEDLHKAINDHGKGYGYAVNRHNGTNNRDGKPTRFNIRCDRFGNPRQSTASTRKSSRGNAAANSKALPHSTDLPEVGNSGITKRRATEYTTMSLP